MYKYVYRREYNVCNIYFYNVYVNIMYKPLPNLT